MLLESTVYSVFATSLILPCGYRYCKGFILEKRVALCGEGLYSVLAEPQLGTVDQGAELLPQARCTASWLSDL